MRPFLAAIVALSAVTFTPAEGGAAERECRTPSLA